MVEFRPSSSVIIVPLLLAIAADAFSSFPSSGGGGGGGGGIGGGIGGGGFGAPISLDRFRATSPADPDAVRRFDPTLLDDDDDGKNNGRRRARHDDEEDDDLWMAVYRSANNLPSVFVRDSFFEAMRVSTTSSSSSSDGFGDSETLVSLSSSSSSSSLSSSDGAMMISNGNDDGEIPVAVARLGRGDADCDNNNDNDYDDDDGCHSSYYIIDSMRCSLRKEDTDPDCDGGSEHAEAIGICIDELVLEYLRRHSEMEKRVEDDDDDDDDDNDRRRRMMMSFDGGIRFRGTLVSGRLLDSRGFREVDELSADMHSHESDYDGALDKYSERSTSRDVAKYPGARDRALRIVSYLGRMDREEDRRRSGSRRARAEKKKRNGDDASGDDGEGEGDFDPWASVKRYL